jgi:Na+/H+-dicarboxylate symporter
MKSKTHLFIFIGIIAGAAFGIFLSNIGESTVRNNIFAALDLFGKTIFIGFLKMIVAPLIFFSILSAITSLAHTGELWRVGWKTLVSISSPPQSPWHWVCSSC